MNNSVLRFIVAATATELLSLDVAKSELDVAGADDEEKLERRIAGVSRLFEGECNRVNFGLATVEEAIEIGAAGTKRLWLRHWPVSSIVSVLEDGVALAPNEYCLGEERFIERLSTASGDKSKWQRRTVVVTYQGGYVLPDGCPEDLSGAALTMVTASWAARGRDPMVKAEDVPGVAKLEYWIGQATGVRNGIPSEVTGVLDRYRNHNFG